MHWYASFEPYGVDGVPNLDGDRPNEMYSFYNKKRRDEWVAADPEHRRVQWATDPDVRYCRRRTSYYLWPATYLDREP